MKSAYPLDKAECRYEIVRVAGKEGSRGKVLATVNGRPLNPRTDLFNHSPDGFEMGYGGSGPAQLALAILADHFHRNVGRPQRKADELAVKYHQAFKARAIAPCKDQYLSFRPCDIAVILGEILHAP